MFNTEFLLKIIDKENSSKYITKLLFLSLVVVIDFFTLFILGNLLGIFLYLAILGLVILIGVSLVLKEIGKQLDAMEESNSRGVYPRDNFYQFTGIILASILIIIPGLLSTLAGLAILIPKLRFYIGRKLSLSLNLDWNAVYEYKEIYSN